MKPFLPPSATMIPTEQRAQCGRTSKRSAVASHVIFSSSASSARGNYAWRGQSFVTQARNNALRPLRTWARHRLIAAGTSVGSTSRSP